MERREGEQKQNKKTLILTSLWFNTWILACSEGNISNSAVTQTSVIMIPDQPFYSWVTSSTTRKESINMILQSSTEKIGTTLSENQEILGPPAPPVKHT